MKTIVCALMSMVLAASAAAVTKGQLDSRMRKIIVKFEELQQNAERRVPAEKLAQAKGLILIDRTKAGFIFAYQGGNGVALARDPATGKWSPPAFVKASEASLGFQVGGQQSFMAILFMTSNAVQTLTQSTFDFGGEASGTAGDSSVKEEETINEDAEVLVYDSRSGLYGGAAVKGGSIAPDTAANLAYYEHALTAKEILFQGTVQASKTAAELIRKLDGHAGEKSSP